MDQGENHIIYTARDIQKYLEGKLGPSEMHAMEKAALDDPFLAEAMEGYSSMKEKEWDSQLLSLRKGLSKKPTAKVVSLSPARRYAFWKAAAAILILFTGVAVTYILTRQPSANNSIAGIDKLKDSSPQITAEPIHADTVSAMSTPITQNKTSNPITAPPVVSRNAEPMTDSKAMYPRPAASKPIPQDSGNLDLAVSKISERAAANDQESLIEQKSREQNKINADKISASEQFNKTPPPLNKKFMAQVVGPDGTPLPFANVSITNQNVGTYADAKGNFRLVSADSLLNVDIKSAGYITKNFTLKSDVPENKIVLAEDELALRSKTVVAGRAKEFAAVSKQRSILIPDSVINVEPEDGWNNYDTYITNNLSIPDNILERKIHGEVEVSFDVQKNGLISNVKVDKSLCGDCDEAALKVIKEGPRWKVKNGNQGTARVKVKF